MIRRAVRVPQRLATTQRLLRRSPLRRATTLRQATDADEAIAQAEAEALEYATMIEEAPTEYLGLAHAYALFDPPNQDGSEVFSLIRDSNLDAENYLDTLFDTGQEHQQGNKHSGNAD